MIPLLLLLAAGSYRNINVFDQRYEVPHNTWSYTDPADWRFPQEEWRDLPATVRATYVVESGPPLRLLLMDRASLDAFEHGGPPTLLAATPAAAFGVLRRRVGSPADCFLVLDNRGSTETAVVHLMVTADSWNAAELSPRRKLVVLAVSFGLFFGMVGYSAAKLWKVFRG